MKAASNSSGLRLDQYSIAREIDHGDEVVYTPFEGECLDEERNDIVVLKGRVVRTPPFYCGVEGTVRDQVELESGERVDLDWIVEVKK